jgi:hypothetical protein
VHQDDRRALALLEGGHADAVCLDKSGFREHAII